MKLIWKFNLVLLGIFALGFLVAGYVSYKALQANAREEVLQHARIMMEAALATRQYTASQVKPLLDTQMQYKFLPQTVPAYAATEQFNELRKKHPDYNYKEATLNPTNPRDRAADWEADVVNTFRSTSTTTEIVGERDTPTGRTLYLSRPIQIKNAACLPCHTTVEAAPKTMIDLYGPANGFGWKMDEIIGAQIVSVPMTIALTRANQSLLAFVAALSAVFIVMLVALNVLMHFFILKPMQRITTLARDVSAGKPDVPEYTVKGKDEIASLGRSFNLMHRSLQNAMRMLEN